MARPDLALRDSLQSLQKDLRIGPFRDAPLHPGFNCSQLEVLVQFFRQEYEFRIRDELLNSGYCFEIAGQASRIQEKNFRSDLLN